MVFAAIVTMKTYVREDPVTCWCPKEFTDSWRDYTNSYCWISNTYYLPMGEDVPRNHVRRKKINPIIYYQWVPVILMFQALLFYLPIAMWRNLNDKTGMDVNDVVETAEKYEDARDSETKEKAINYLVMQMHRSLDLLKKPARFTGCCKEGCAPNCKWILTHVMCCMSQKTFGNYIVILYFVTKLLFLINIVSQIFMLNWFLGNDFTMYGIDVIRMWVQKAEWRESRRFPRVTLCDIDIRRVGDVHRYTFQCVLPINLFNERIYLFIWFWFLAMSVITLFGIIMWALRFLVGFHRRRYILHHLKATGSYSAELKEDQLALDGFIKDYLQPDGFLVLRLVDINTNKVTMNDFLARLWETYKSLPRVKKRLESNGSSGRLLLSNNSIMGSAGEVFDNV